MGAINCDTNILRQWESLFVKVKSQTAVLIHCMLIPRSLIPFCLQGDFVLSAFPCFLCSFSLLPRLAPPPLLSVASRTACPPSHKTRDQNVSHDGEGWQEVNITLCCVAVLLIFNPKPTQTKEESRTVYHYQVSNSQYLAVFAVLLKRLEKLLSGLLIWERNDSLAPCGADSSPKTHSVS